MSGTSHSIIIKPFLGYKTGMAIFPRNLAFERADKNGLRQHFRFLPKMTPSAINGGWW